MPKHRFEDYLKAEDWLHFETAQYLKIAHPDVLWWHTPNEGRRTPFERFKFKWLGARSGVSDIIIVYDGRILALELKAVYLTGKRGGMQKSQTQFLADMTTAGGTAATAWTRIEAVKIIEEFLRIPENPNTSTAAGMIWP
jgi:hypothetical protein